MRIFASVRKARFTGKFVPVKTSRDEVAVEVAWDALYDPQSRKMRDVE